MSNSVFVPGHITGFFTIENHEIKLKNGSCGAGFLLSRGVKTTVSQSDELVIEVNQGDSTVIDEVLSILELDNTDFKIAQDIQLPIGAGFGTSAASALSLTLTLNEFLDLGYSQELCGQIAHMAEVNLGAGLGDVIAQTGHGMVLRTKPGAPGIGEIESFEEEVFIGWKTFGEIETSDIILNPHYMKVKTQIDYINSSSDILGSSMAMLGNTIFAFAYNEDTLKKLNIENLHIDKLNNIGIVYD